MAQYLDKTGLSLYDVLIKKLIKDGNDVLISKINDVLGGSDVDVSITDIVSLIGDIEDGKSIADLLNALSDSINTLNGGASVEGSVKSEVAALKATHDEDIKKLKKEHDDDIKYVKDYIAELLGGSDVDGGDIASMSEIVGSIKRLEEALGIIEDSDDEPSIMERVDALEMETVYIPSQAIQDADMTSLKHEGLPATKATDFADKKYTYSEMFDMILFPTVLPTKSGPSLSWKNASTKNILVGTDITSMIISNANVADYLTYNLGTWTYNTGMTVSNGHGTPSVERTNVPTAVDGTYTMSTKTISFRGKVTYEAGDAPKDNKGVEHSELAYAGGTVYTSYIYYKPYYNWYASTVEGGVLTQQAVIESCGISAGATKTGDTSKNVATSGIKLASHKLGVSEQMFSTPRAITEFWQFNTASNVWTKFDLVDGAPAGWVRVQDTDTTNGIKYWTYTYKGPDNDPIDIILKF